MPANIDNTLEIYKALMRPDQGRGLDLGPMVDWAKQGDMGAASAPVAAAGPAPSAEPPLGWFEGFMRNSLWNLNPESLIGNRPRPDLEQWQADNPVGSIASTILGSAPAYVAGGAVGGPILRAVAPRVMARMAPGSAFAAARPIAAAATRTAAEMIPFEAARMIGSAAFATNPEALEETAISAALDIGTAGLFGAGAKFLRQLKQPRIEDPGMKVKEFFPDYDDSLSAQEQIQRLRTIKGNVGPEMKEVHDRLDAALVDRMNLVRFEGTSEKNYVKDFVGGGDAKDFRRFFKTQQSDVPGASILRQRFMTRDVGGFKNEREWQQAWAGTGLPDDAFGYIQFPRSISFGKEAGATDFSKSVTNSLLPMPEGWWLREEAESGLYVMAKKIQGVEGKALPSDRWVIFKTSEPNKIIGQDVVSGSGNRAAVFMNKIQQKLDQKALGQLRQEVPDSLAGLDLAFVEAVPKQKYLQKIHGASDRLREMLPAQMAQATKELQQEVGEHWTWLKGLIAPAQAQFRNAPAAEYTRLRAQNIYSAAEAKANSALFGDQWEDIDKNLYKSIFGQRKVGGLKAAVDPLTDDDLKLVTGILNNRIGLKEADDLLAAAPGDQRKRIMNFLTMADEQQGKLMKEVQQTQRYTGAPLVEPMANHYGVPHTWRGNYRMRVEDELGRTLAYGGGRNPQEAISEAKRIISETGRGKMAWDKAQLADQMDDLIQADRVGSLARARNPGLGNLGKAPLTHRERLNIMGFLGENQPLTRDELFDIIQSHYRRNYNHTADLVVRKHLTNDVIETARQYGKDTFDQLNYRLAKMSGVKGWIDKGVNKAVTKVLGPVLGRDAADQLARTVNQLEYSLQLLTGNLAFPILNAGTFIQTVLPKVALLTKAPPERWGEFMQFAPLLGPDGVPKGVMGTFEPLRISTSAFRALRNPDGFEREAFQRAAREGVIAPRFVEEFLGEKSRIAATFGEVLKGRAPVTRLLKNLSEWPAAKSEELSRSHALMVGVKLGRKLFGLDEAIPKDRESLYQFAKQFSHRTMYQYSTADRAKIFNGPMGSVAGLFKNWMFHNIADMGTYAGEAFKYGNVLPLAWALGGTATMAGVGGLPLYAIADQAAKAMSDKSLMQLIYENFGKTPEGNVGNLSDAIYYGLPGLFGISLQSSASGPFNNPVKDMNFLFNFALLDRMKKIGTFFGDTYSQWDAGTNPFENDRTIDLAMYAFAPRTLYKAMSQVEDGALKSIRNGRPIADVAGMKAAGVDLNWLTNTFGFTPTTIARAYEASEQLHSDQEKLAAMTRQYGEAYARAWQSQDEKTMAFVLGRAIAAGADLGRVMRSAVTRVQEQERAVLDYDFRTLPGAYDKLQAYGLGSF